MLEIGWHARFALANGHRPAQPIGSYDCTRPRHRNAGEYIGPISLLCALQDTRLEHDALDRFAHPAALRLSTLLGEQVVRKLTPDLDIAIFADVKLAGVRIAETIDDGAKAFRQIGSLLERREQFAKVVRGKPADMTMAEWYIRETTRGFATGSTMKRLARFGVFTAPGV